MEQTPRQHRALVLTLIVVATVLGFLAAFAVWANRQALETDTWTETSSELLEDEDIQTAVAGYLVDQLYANVDVEAQLQGRLPPEASALAGPAAGGLRELANRAALEALGRPRVQALWEEANRAAHERLVALVEGESENIRLEGDQATLDLGALLTNLSERTGIGGNLAAKLPEDAGEIVIVKSDQIELAQDAVVVLRGLAIVFTVLSFALFSLAVYLARGWRREALRAVGFAFVVMGIAVLAARGLAGNAVVDALASTAAVEPAAESTWEIGTSLLRESGISLVAYGLLIVLAAWLAGPSSAARGLRRGLAPYLSSRRIAYSAAAVIVLLVLWWGPTPGTQRPIPALLLIAFFLAAVEALRRQSVREFPDEERGELLASVRSAFERRREALPGPPAPPGLRPSEDDARLARLTQLGELRKAGVLTDEELAREKERILGPA